MKMILIALALVVMTGQAQAEAPTDQQCSAAANLSAMALSWRQAGISEDVAMEFLRQKKVYSGLPVWAVKSAYNAPPDIAAWILKGSVMGECRNREE